jgi:hypothetical protein
MGLIIATWLSVSVFVAALWMFYKQVIEPYQTNKQNFKEYCESKRKYKA